MASRDSAFLWETEALRSTRRDAPSGTGDTVLGNGEDWLTIREASEATGVPMSTIRKWARHHNIASHLEKTDEGHVRIVSMKGIRQWTDEIGRDLDGGPAVSEAETEVDLTSKEETSSPAPAEMGEETAAPEGTMLVPLDAWNKMLNQLGNLHEAGQQLAEARERAAKAETEAAFLRERLRELRQEKEEAVNAQTRPIAETAAPPSNEDEDQTLSTTAMVRKIYSDWRRNRRK